MNVGNMQFEFLVGVLTLTAVRRVLFNTSYALKKNLTCFEESIGGYQVENKFKERTCHGSRE